MNEFRFVLIKATNFKEFKTYFGRKRSNSYSFGYRYGNINIESSQGIFSSTMELTYYIVNA
jgi:hypothetical protein